MKTDADVVIIGGGFFGCVLALLMRKHFENVIVVEEGNNLLTRASYINQARIHNGYHYPRSFMTAYRSRVNFPQFTSDYKKAVVKDFEKVYAITKHQSKITARQFVRFCNKIGAFIKPAPDSIKRLFDNLLIEEVFTVREYAFDALILRKMLKNKLFKSGVTVYLNKQVNKIYQGKNDRLMVSLADGKEIKGKLVFNCTYSRINHILHNSGLPLVPLKHEITEMALIGVPDKLKKLGITVMDGPFFSTMPFPPENLHTLSHVRYTPHTSWLEPECYKDPYLYLDNLKIETNFQFMIRDAQRFIPTIAEAKYVRSLYEIKTTLPENELDDGRPIMFKENHGFKNLFLVLGGKLDNIYDVITAIEKSVFKD